mmetsp:Transcript_14131/g.32802  ORF Transcript_14131/g.32802 Transcript_14131/m.32802 type:complete len:772 (-) Transcript_14131:500-2815(-)
MISTDAVAVDHYRLFDDRDRLDNEVTRRFSKKRNTFVESDHRVSAAVKSEPSNTILSFPSSTTSSATSTASISFDSSADDDVLKLPRLIGTLNVVRPVPKRISEQFYHEAHREGSTLHEANQAAIMAHDWNRKWVYQDEAYHTMPEEDFFRSSEVGIPVSYNHNGFGNDINHSADYARNANARSTFDMDTNHPRGTNNLLVVLEREEGAKNPSLGSPQEGKRKRYTPQTAGVTSSHHHSTAKQHVQPTQPDFRKLQVRTFDKTDVDYDWNVMVASTEASTSVDSLNQDTITNHNGESGFTDSNPDFVGNQDSEHHEGPSDLEQGEEFDQRSLYSQRSSNIQLPMPIRPFVVKPMAIRAKRSEYILPQPTNTRLSPFAPEYRNETVERGIPQGIMMSDRNGLQCVSPMSFSQFTGCDSLSPGTSPGNEMIGMTVLKTDNEYPDFIEDYDDSLTNNEGQESTFSCVDSMEMARDEILRVLAINDDVESDDFKSKVRPLEKFFLGQDIDTRRMPDLSTPDPVVSHVPMSSAPDSIDGMWLTLSKPNFFGKLGENDNGDPLYTLGRMSFDMFSPTNLICSLQGNFNRIEIVNEHERKAMLERVPKKLREEVEAGKTTLRTYHVVTAFTIEPSLAAYPNAPNKDVIRPIKAIMTTYGYSLPDPDTPNRHSVWFTGGRIEPNNDISDIIAWKNFFAVHPPKHTFGEKAKLLAVKLLMGATMPTEVDPEDGSMNYVFTRPIGGHGMAYVDVIYLDESLRIVRGHRGTIFVFSRISDVH